MAKKLNKYRQQRVTEVVKKPRKQEAEPPPLPYAEGDQVFVNLRSSVLHKFTGPKSVLECLPIGSKFRTNSSGFLVKVLSDEGVPVMLCASYISTDEYEFERPGVYRRKRKPGDDKMPR